MDIHRILRGFWGVLILVSLLLWLFASQWWLLLTLAVGLNLVQSSVTDFCPLMWVLRKVGFQAVGG